VETVLATEGLTKVYEAFLGGRRVRALDNLNLQVGAGETFGLVGPNGSGKTTTLKLLLGLIFPTAGRARLFGRTVFDVEVKERIGFLPESPYFYDCFNGEELLDFYGRLFGLSRSTRHQRVDELLTLVGMQERRRMPLRMYSRGMLQRIGLAQALINDPDLLILDEPTAGLDPFGSYQIRSLIEELRARGKTILLCSHYLTEVEYLCDRVGILNRGRLVACGSVTELVGERMTTEVSFRGLSPEALRELSATAMTAVGRDGVAKVHLEQPELAAKVIDDFRGRGGELVEMRQVRPSLEDLFLEALREEAE